MRPFTERKLSERTAAERGGRNGGKEKWGEGRQWARERETEREGGWGVVIAGSFQALEVEKEENRKISCCVGEERRDRARVRISELLNSCVCVCVCVFFFLPLLSLARLLIWDLFKSRTAPQEDFSLLGKGNPAPSLSHYTHTLAPQNVWFHCQRSLGRNHIRLWRLVFFFFSSSSLHCLSSSCLSVEPRRSLTLPWGQ